MASGMLAPLLALSLGACRSEGEGSADAFADSSLPGPERAAAAAAGVTPALTANLAEKDLKFGAPVFLRAFKAGRELEVWVRHREGDFRRFHSYRIAAASGKPGPKLAEGDRQVPEGFYHFGRRAMKPDSRYHLAFNIGFPNAYDRARGRTGSFIMVHGGRVSVGCLAMTDAKIEEIYTLCDAALAGGQPFIRIHVFPFRMTAAAMARRDGHRWHGFWENLREGYEFFERERRPPNVRVEDGRYVFEPVD